MNAAEIIAQTKELPLVPETARTLVLLLNQSDIHRQEVIRLVRCDNVLTAKLLRVCNSVGSGFKSPVSSIDQAVLLVGDKAIHRMVCAIGFGGAMGFSMSGHTIEANGLWSHSLHTGMAAEYLTEAEGYGAFQPSLAFTAGLLHDIGKLVLNQILTPRCRMEIRTMMAEKALPRVEVEKLVLGADHAEVGACLLQKWGLPEIIIEATANHHAPVVRPVVQLSAVVCLANAAAHLVGVSTGADASALRPDPRVAMWLGLPQSKVEQMAARVHRALKAPHQLLIAA